MANLIARPARLVPYTKRPKHSASFVTAYIYEPSAEEAGAQLGNLYVVVEVLASGRASEEVVDLVIQSVGEKYYNNSATQAEPLARFEAAVRQTNHELSEYVGRGNAAWIGKLSAVIAVQTASELHVSHTGSAEAFLYRGRAASRITQTEPSKPATPSKTFGVVATGQLEIGDKFLLATPALVHQVPLTKLQSVIGDTNPNEAIAELSHLLADTETSRIAAIVVEMTTPELAAVKVRSEEPSEIELQNRESFTEAAIKSAAPIVESTAQGSKRLAIIAHDSWRRAQPHLISTVHSFGATARRVLASKSGRRWSLMVTALIVLFLATSIWQSRNQAAADHDFASYQELFQKYTQAQKLVSTDRAGARQSLVQVQTDLTKLTKKAPQLERQLKDRPLLEGETTSVSAFKNQIADTINEIDGLVKISPMTVGEIGGAKGRPEHFESDGNRAYIFDSSNKNAITIVNLLTGDQTESKAGTTGLGDVISTTLSANNDGIFILTKKPSVWFYRFANDSLAEQSIAYGEWPKSQAIGSYATNLYLLGDTAIYKMTRNSTGYSPKIDYISTTTSSPHASALAVDGWVYLASDAGLQRLLGPSLKQTLPRPPGISAIAKLRSAADGTVITAICPSAHRIVTWSANANQVTFKQQLIIEGNGSLRDALYDQKTGRIFATVDNRLVSFKFKP